jgi:hypothetical protein
MSIKNRAKKTVAELVDVSSASWTDKEKVEAAHIIENAIIKTVHEFCDTSVKVIDKCCSADLDKAHKLNEEIKLAREAIIANLTSMR